MAPSRSSSVVGNVALPLRHVSDASHPRRCLPSLSVPSVRLASSWGVGRGACGVRGGVGRKEGRRFRVCCRALLHLAGCSECKQMVLILARLEAG